MSQTFRTIAVLGTGLIGASLALTLKEQKGAPRVVGFDLKGDSRRGAAGLTPPEDPGLRPAGSPESSPATGQRCWPRSRQRQRTLA